MRQIANKSPEPNFISLNREFLKPNSRINADIFILLGKRYTLYANKDMQISFNHLNRLKSRSEKKVYIRNADGSALYTYFEENIAFILSKEQVPFEEKAEILYQTSYSLIKNIFENKEDLSLLQRVRPFIKDILPFLDRYHMQFYNLIKLYKSENYTYSHGINVSAILIALASKLNISDREQLTDIGVGGFLLDIGKAEIPADIINKKGVLTHEENELIRSHPIIGAEIVKKAGLLSPITLDIIAKHHENMLGTGYPKRIGGQALSIYASMAQVVDTFDAITSDRPYSQAESKAVAVKYLLNRREEYNSRVFLSFLEIIGAEGH
ncbi:MAG TPA: HD domain-containing protein [Candidatus Marinimicrobia bacterium]|nr:HD domain-containing protein [Candidatus Neomarinimicrobiota bacterium]